MRPSDPQTISGPFGEFLPSPDTRGKSAPHFHSTHAIGMTRSGGGTLFAMGTSWDYSAGMVVVTNPFAPHWGRPSPGGLDYSLLYPCPIWLRTLLGAGAERFRFERPVIGDPETASAIVAAFDRLTRNRDAGLLPGSIRRLFMVHAEKNRLCGAMAEDGIARRNRREETAIGAPSVAALAARSGLSRAYFSRKYRSAVGLSPLDHRRQARVLAALSMIEKGASLADAAADAGFADQPHMTRQFRQILGVTPAAYRARG